jgi:ABC-type enterochelin transport system substrate-binding protein
MSSHGVFFSIDSFIQIWARSNSLRIFESFAGRQERFCYVSSSRGECFQISIQPPLDKVVVVDAWTVETLDNMELNERWTVSVPELPETLDLALRTVRDWSARDLIK